MICKTCNGTGEQVTYENQAPLGSGMIWNEEIIDDCPDCTGNGVCPQCSHQWSDETIEYYYDCIDNYRINNFICPFCRWQGGGE
jgi:DnaJ-class molecular chaperone